MIYRRKKKLFSWSREQNRFWVSVIAKILMNDFAFTNGEKEHRWKENE